MSAQVIIAAGGTGGHVFPALAVAKGLMARGHGPSWVGSNRGLEARVVPQAGMPLLQLDFQGLRGRGLWALLQMPFGLLRATLRCWAWMRKASPRLVIVFGGYVSFPVAVVARLMGRPVMVHEQNAVMGTANRWIARWAQAVVVSFERTRFAPGNSQWIGNPVRQELLALGAARSSMAERTGPLRLLVLGGSLGARPLNEGLPAALATLAKEGLAFEVRHQSGPAGQPDCQARYAQAGLVAEVLPFIDDMSAVYAWADLAVCRAGASTVAEMTAVGLPAVYVPLPHAIDDHQTANAAAVVAAGGAWLVPQGHDFEARLSERLRGLNRTVLLQATQALEGQQPKAVEARMLDLCEALMQAEGRP